MQFFDTHCHIGLIYDDPIEQIRVVQAAKQADVTRIVSINNSLRDFKKVYPVLKTFPGIYHAVGVAPSEITNPGENWEKTIEESLSLPNVVAVGECGLDYCKQFGNKRTQIEFFIKQLDIAQNHDLPVIIHNREAGTDVFEVLKERIPSSGAILHCYSENGAYARKCVEAGLNVYFSFAGNLTYRNARNLHETIMVLKEMDVLDKVLIETESPFMIPAEFRLMKRTKPAMLPSTATFLAGMLDMPLEELSEKLWKNSCRIFKLPE